MKLRPMAGKALIRPEKDEKVTKQGIVLPDTAQRDELQQGVVVSVGPYLKKEGELREFVHEGDKVILKKYGPDKVKIEGEDYIVAEEDDLVGVID